MINTEQIEFLLESGMKVLKIYENDSLFSWWIVNQFTPAKLNGEEGVSFHTVKGIELTDFVNYNHNIQARGPFIKGVESFLSKRSFLICNFHCGIKFKYYVDLRKQS